MNRFLDGTFLRRYRTLILAMFLFFLVGVGLAVFNFFESYRIDRMTAVRDLAGGMRSSSQMVLRALLEVRADLTAGRAPSPESVETLSLRAMLIERTLAVFRSGGPIDDTPSAPSYPPLEEAELLSLVREVERQWAPLFKALPLAGQPELAVTTAAVERGRRVNADLFDAINRLVQASQARVESETGRLRLVQMLGVGLIPTVLLIVAILAVGRLVAGDRSVAQSQRETLEILSTVREGLFLITPEYRVGKQRSASLEQVTGMSLIPGDSILDLLRILVDAKTLEAARDYLELLFGRRVRESLIAALNPLSEVEIKNRNGPPRYLSFQFNRVLEGEEVTHLLVTVQDATQRVHMAAELAAAKNRSRDEVDALLRVLNNDPSDVRNFLRRAEERLERVNDLLREVSQRGGSDYLTLVNEVFGHIHAIKGEAGTLNLDTLENIAHDFETDLIALRGQGVADGSDMVRLTLHLDSLLQGVAGIRGFQERVTRTGPAAPQPLAERAAAALHTLAQRIAKSQGKEVRVSAELEALDHLPQQVTDQLHGISVQLLRNAVAHGIEPPQERLALGKPTMGSIHFRCQDLGNRTYELSVRDDGQGIDPARIRQALLRDGRYDAAQVEAMEDQDVVLKIFDPGFSTVVNASRDAGHGAGMDVVRGAVDALAGRITFRTKNHSHTEFCVRFPWPTPILRSVGPARPSGAAVTPLRRHKEVV